MLHSTLSQVIPYLKYVHGTYNTLVLLFFLYQGWLGLRIRRERIRRNRPLLAAIRRHRKLGPVLVILGIAGFLAGLTIVYLRKGYIFVNPLHFIAGSGVALLIITTFLISKKIKGRDSPYRKPHFIVGLCLIFFYLVQAFLGIGILLRTGD